MKQYVKAGDRVMKEMPWSEVCMHMRIAGKLFDCEVKDNSVQLWKDGRVFSAPITHGEAGFYHDDNRGYYYIV